jgi:hypothetical protein
VVTHKKKKERKAVGFFFSLEKGKKSLTHLNQFREKEKNQKDLVFLIFAFPFFGGFYIAFCSLLSKKQKQKPIKKKHTNYLVDPASSHMLVSKIKPCMSKNKPIERRICEWLITSVIVYLMVHYAF